MLQLILILAAELALLAFVVVQREPKLLLPAVIVFLPIEVFETQAVDALGEGGASGAIRSLFNPGQTLMIVTVLVGAVRLRHRPGALIPPSSLALPLLALFALLMLGVAWSDSYVPANSVLILPLYVAFVFVAPSFVENRRDVERLLAAFLVAASLLAFIAIAQRLLGVFNWRDVLIQSDGVSYRANGTFADPNILARFLAITMALAAGLILATGPRRLTVYLAAPMLGLGGLAIIATASRSGWLMLILVGFLVVLFAPIERYRKRSIVLASGAGLAALAGLALAQGGADGERIRSLADAAQVLGQREYLIRAGFEMFKDSPFIGLGSGNYQHALITSYLHLLPAWARVSLSHTSLISVLAELGIVGIFMFGFVGLRTTATVVRTYLRDRDPYHRLLVGWLGAALIGIVLHSQSEGRFLDEPFFWVLLVLLIAFETVPGLVASNAREHDDAERAAALAA